VEKVVKLTSEASSSAIGLRPGFFCSKEDEEEEEVEECWSSLSMTAKEFAC
jgi:hypothetical protein